MNTSFYIKADHCLNKDWRTIITGWIQYVETEWSRFRSDSELSELNELPVGEEMTLSPPLFDILRKAEEYRQKTKGLFSPYLLPQMRYHGYDQAFPFTNASHTNNVLPEVYNKMDSPLQFILDSNKVKKIFPGKIDLGGIGKGYAVQSAALWLKEVGGAHSGIVDGGGDITVWSDGEKEWLIGVAHPCEQNQEIAQFRLKNASVATSNILYRSWNQGNQKKHHLLNGQTGLPVESSVLQATVVCDSLLDAEVATKLRFMNNGLDPEFKKSIKIHSTVIVDKNGKITIDEYK